MALLLQLQELNLEMEDIWPTKSMVFQKILLRIKLSLSILLIVAGMTPFLIKVYLRYISLGSLKAYYFQSFLILY